MENSLREWAAPISSALPLGKANDNKQGYKPGYVLLPSDGHLSNPCVAAWL